MTLKQRFILYGLVFEVGLLGAVFFFPIRADDAFMCFGGHVMSLLSTGENNATTWHRLLQQPGGIMCLWVISLAVTGAAGIGILKVFERAKRGKPT